VVSVSCAPGRSAGRKHERGLVAGRVLSGSIVQAIAVTSDRDQLPAIATASAATAATATAATAAFAAAAIVTTTATAATIVTPATAAVAAATTTTTRATAAVAAAATTVAATAAAAIAAATAAAEAAATATAALLALLGFVHAEWATVERATIHALDRLGGFLGGSHGHEGEAARAAGLSVRDQMDITDRSEFLERRTDALRVGIER
jgi:hypothetical protein